MAINSSAAAGEEFSWPSNLLFERFFDLIPDLAVIATAEGHFVRVNPAWRKILGYAQEDLEGKSFVDLIHPEDVESTLREVSKQVSGEYTFNFINRYRAKDATYRWLEWTATPAHQQKLLYATARDVTGRKLSEQLTAISLRVSERLNQNSTLRQLIQDVLNLIKDFSHCDSVGIRLNDGDDFPYYCSQGFPVEHLLFENTLCARDSDGSIIRDSRGNAVLECMCGNILRGRFDPSHPFFTVGGSFWTNSTTQLLASTTDADRQARTRNRCNGEGYESVALIPMINPAGKVIGLIQLNDHQTDRFNLELIQLYENIAKNIAVIVDLKRGAELLMDNEAFNRILTDSAPNPILTVYPDSTIRYVNPAFEKITGYSRAELIGRKAPYPWWPKSEAGQFLEENVTQRERQSNIMERRFQKKSGEMFWIEVNIEPIQEEGQARYFIANWVDITERKKVEDVLKYQALLVESVSDAVISTDSNFLIVSWNKAAEIIYGWQPQEVIGKPLDQITSTRFRQGDREKSILELNRNGKWDGEVTQIRKDGALISIMSSVSLVKDNLGRAVGIVGCNRDITEHKNNEEKMHEQAIMLASIGDSVIATDASYHITFWNKAAEKMYGYSQQEILGQRVTILKPEFVGMTNQEALEKLTKTGRLQVELTHVTRSGRQITLDSSIQLLHDEKGRPSSLISINRDITARKEAEEQLRASESRYHSLFTNMFEGYAYCRMIFENGRPRDFIYLEINDNFTKLTGLKEVSGKKVSELVPGIHETNPELLEIYGRVSLDGRPEHFETHIPELHIWLSISVYSPLKEHFVAVFENITERVQAEQALKESEESLKKAQQTAHVGSWKWNIQNQRLEWSEEMHRIFGIDKKSFTGNLNDVITSAIHPDDRQKVQDSNAQVAAEGKPVPLEYRIVLPDKSVRTVWGEADELVMDSTGKPHILTGIVQDITERKQAEKTLQALYEKEKALREELEKEAKTRAMFIDILAHELRTPLTPMLASSGMLLEILQNQKGQIVQKLAANVYSSSDTLARRLEELLDMARYARGSFRLKRAPADISNFLGQVLSRFEPSLEQLGQKLVVQIESDLPQVSLDTSRLEQVIVNLLSNASKFSPSGSEISISAKGKGNNLNIAVKDKGTGISADGQRTIFEPYHRVQQDRNAFSGTGLGLAICKQIVEAHAGKIWVESEEGKGSTFIFEIPMLAGL